MGRLLVLALVLGPFVEIAAFVVIGHYIGVVATMVWVACAAAAGIIILRRQPDLTIKALRHAVATNNGPLLPIIDSARRIVAGILLIVPGFVGDVIALLLLLPGTGRCLSHILAPGRRPRKPLVINGTWHHVEPERIRGQSQPDL